MYSGFHVLHIHQVYLSTIFLKEKQKYIIILLQGNIKHSLILIYILKK